jgi:hypothetical protein
MKNFTQKFIVLFSLVFTMSFTVNAQSQNNINLPQGWSMFGYNCEEPQEVTPALNEIVDKIVIVKDHFGNAYLPELDFNGIGDFTNGVGYQIKMIEEVDGFQFCSSVLPDDGIGQADLDAVQTELAIALESLSDLTEQMGEIELSYSGEDILYISEFVNSLLLDVSALLDSDALDLNSLTELAENYLTPGIAYLTDNSLVTDEEVSLLYDILFDIAAIVANQEDGIGQDDVDAAYDEGAASVTPEDGITQADVDALAESYAGYTAPLDLQIGDLHAGGMVFQINENGSGLVAAMEDLQDFMNWGQAVSQAPSYSLEGYTGWHLPSLETLELMYNTIGQGADNSGNFEYDWYWSSSESNLNYAWSVNFNNGVTLNHLKIYPLRVRVIRAF